MNDLQIFSNEKFGELRTILVEREVYFVGIDVAKMLEYAKPSQAVIDHCKGIRKLGIPSGGGIQQTNCITQGDVLRLIVKAADQSKNPSIKEKATETESWIFDEVIPTVLHHGMYAVDQLLDNPDLAIRAFTALKEEREKRLAAEQQIEIVKPKVIFADAVSASNTSILIGDLAKLLKQNGYNTGQKRLFEWMRSNGYLMKSGDSKNMPTQRAMEQGLFEVKESTVSNPDGSIRTTKTTKVTGKGQVYFINLLIKEKGA